MKPKTKEQEKTRNSVNLLYFNKNENKTINKKKIIGVCILIVIICFIIVAYAVYASNENFRNYVDMNILHKEISENNLKTASK